MTPIPEPASPVASGTPAPEVHVRATKYVVSCLPDGNPDEDVWGLTVEERSPGRWAVLSRGFCFDVNGDREYEANVTGRTAEFRVRFRFDFETAMRLAREFAPTLTCNGLTATEVAERWADR